MRPQAERSEHHTLWVQPEESPRTSNYTARSEAAITPIGQTSPGGPAVWPPSRSGSATTQNRGQALSSGDRRALFRGCGVRPKSAANEAQNRPQQAAVPLSMVPQTAQALAEQGLMRNDPELCKTMQMFQLAIRDGNTNGASLVTSICCEFTGNAKLPQCRPETRPTSSKSSVFLRELPAYLSQTSTSSSWLGVVHQVLRYSIRRRASTPAACCVWPYFLAALNPCGV